MTELVVVIPTLGRPHSLQPLAETFSATTRNYRLLFVVDLDDEPTWEAFELLRAAHPELDGLAHDGTYVEKTNAGIAASDEPLILPGADDIRPHVGWLEAAKAKMVGPIGFVSLNDLGNHDVMAGKYATLPLIARWYAESLGDDLYHAGYHHNGCDVDASLRAIARGAFAYAPNAVMEHLHPDWSKGEIDETYRRGAMNEAKRQADHELLERRWPGWEQIIASR